MTSLLTIRPAADAPPWICEAEPHAYDEAVRVQMKAMPGIEWLPKSKVYRGPVEAVRLVAATLEAARVVKVEIAHPLLALPEPNARQAGRLSSTAWPPDFRDYQRDGASWCRWMLATTGGALLADEMGIGKSAQAIAALDALTPTEPPYSTLVVCPAVVVPHWYGQIRRWSSRDAYAYWQIMSYERFTKAIKAGNVITPWTKTAVFDEIQYLSNPTSQRSKAAAAWRAAHPEALVLGLSGTPMTTRPRDLWHPLNILWPGRFGGKWLFEKRYCNGHYREITTDNGQPITRPTGEPLSVWDADGVSRAEELGVRLAACMLRRTKAQVLAELPPKTRTIIDVEVPAKARKDLARAAAAIDWSGAVLARGGVSSLLREVEGYKLDAAEQLAKDARANGESVLIFTTRRRSAYELAKRLEAPCVTGDVPPSVRHAMLDGSPIGVATIYAMTTGVDLTSYSVVIFTGLDWVPSNLLQAEDRAHRLGQQRAVTIYYLVGRQTLDEVVRERVIERLDVWASLSGGKAGDGGGLSADLKGGNEDSLIAGIVAAIKKGAT